MSNEKRSPMGERWAASDYLFLFSTVAQGIIDGKITEEEAKRRFITEEYPIDFDKYLAAQREQQSKANK